MLSSYSGLNRRFGQGTQKGLLSLTLHDVNTHQNTRQNGRFLEKYSKLWEHYNATILFSSLKVCGNGGRCTVATVYTAYSNAEKSEKQYEVSWHPQSNPEEMAERLQNEW